MNPSFKCMVCGHTFNGRKPSDNLDIACNCPTSGRTSTKNLKTENDGTSYSRIQNFQQLLQREMSDKNLMIEEHYNRLMEQLTIEKEQLTMQIKDWYEYGNTNLLRLYKAYQNYNNFIKRDEDFFEENMPQLETSLINKLSDILSNGLQITTTGLNDSLATIITGSCWLCNFKIEEIEDLSVNDPEIIFRRTNLLVLGKNDLGSIIYSLCLNNENTSPNHEKTVLYQGEEVYDFISARPNRTHVLACQTTRGRIYLGDIQSSSITFNKRIDIGNPVKAFMTNDKKILIWHENRVTFLAADRERQWSISLPDMHDLTLADNSTFYTLEGGEVVVRSLNDSNEVRRFQDISEEGEIKNIQNLPFGFAVSTDNSVRLYTQYGELLKDIQTSFTPERIAVSLSALDITIYVTSNDSKLHRISIEV